MREASLVLGLRQQIVERLRDDILCGRLREGVRLSEQDLVSRFGVSRTPIREALAQLSHEGLLESQPNRGVRVAEQPPDEILRLVVPIRLTLESFALRLIFDRLTDDDFLEWDATLARLEKACRECDYDAIAEHDIAFHRSIIRRAGQRDLEAIWSAILARVRSHFWTRRAGRERLLNLHREHREIVDASRRGDQEAAIEALERSVSPGRCGGLDD